MKRLVTILAVVWATAVLAGQVQTSPTAARADWIRKAIAQLQSFRPSRDTRRAQIKKDKKELRYGVQKAGLLVFASNEWLYVVSHSMHTEDGLPDIIMGIDQLGGLYINDGHDCGGVRFTSSNTVPPRTASEFIERFSVWPKDWKWRKYTEADLVDLTDRQKQKEAPTSR